MRAVSPAGCGVALGLLLGCLAAGCALWRPEPLEVPPGHGAVLGRVELASPQMLNAALDIVRVDGTFDHALMVSPGHRDFAIVLPRGGYRIVALRGFKEPQEEQVTWPLRVGFEVTPATTAYIGTLRISPNFGSTVHVSVVDEYEDTLRNLRGLYPDLPQTIVRRLMTPS